MGKTGGRGSYKLYSDISPTKAKKLQSALAGWKIIDWHELGKPGIEVITAGISGSPGHLGKVVTKLTKIKEIRGLEILINGQPKPEIAEVRFQMRNG
jgi:hypothetical protein